MNSEKYINSILENEVKGEAGKLNPSQLKTLKKYDRANKLNGGMKKSTRANTLSYLRSFGLSVNKPYEKVTKKDIEDFIEKQMDSKRKSTVAHFKTVLRSFYKWLNKGKTPASVKWFKITRHKRKLTPSDLINREEIKKMAESCNNPRDSCLAMLLYESGARASELVSINIEDLEFNEYGVRVFLRESKTRERPVLCIDSTPYIKTWLNHHPFKENKEAPLFINFSGRKPKERLTPVGLGKIINKIGKYAGLKKKVYPHLFRHSRVTELLILGFNETELKKFAGWSENSSMISTYAHLANKNIEDKLLRVNGIKEEETKKVNVLKRKLCPFCDYENPATNKICNSCSRPIDFKEAIKLIREREKYDKLIDLLIGDKVIGQRVKELQGGGKSG